MAAIRLWGAMRTWRGPFRKHLLRAGTFLLLAFALLIPPASFSRSPLEDEAFFDEGPAPSKSWEESFVFPVYEEDIHIWDKSFPLNEVLRKLSSPDFSPTPQKACIRGSGAFQLPFNKFVNVYLKYFSERSPGSFRYGHKRSGLYEDIIMQEINRRGLPRELLYLCMIESMFKPRAVSPANAKGLWQFIYPTGRRYDLTINYWIDERYDPVKSTRAAMDYLSDLYDIFGDWHLAAAAYNCGEDRVARELRQNGCDDYWCLLNKDQLPYETRHYVPKVVAMAIIGSNPARYGFYNLKKNNSQTYSTVTVDDATDLGLIAELTGVSTNKIEELNPEIIRFCTPPGVRRYRVKVPAGKAESFNRKYARLSSEKRHAFKKHKVEKGQSLRTIASGYGTSYKLLASVNGMSTSAVLPAGQDIVVPVPKTRKYQKYKKPKKPDRGPGAPTLRTGTKKKTAHKGKKKHIYVVEPGDTMWTIAKANNASIEDLKKWNPGLTSDNLYYGDKIAIYSKEKPKAPQKTRHSVKSKGPTREFSYTVREGDRCYYMARHYGITSQEIIEENDLDKNCSVRPGQELTMVVPEKAPKTMPPTADEAPPPKSMEDFAPPAPDLPATKAKAGQPKGTKEVAYVVEEGDCLWLIARNHDVHMKEVLAWNGLEEGYTPRPGQELTIYVGPGWKPPPKDPESKKEKKPEIKKSARDPDHGTRGPAITYRVEEGDNLWLIARNHDVHVKEIRKWNDLESDVLNKGQELTIKPGPAYKPAQKKSSSVSRNNSTASKTKRGDRKLSYKVKPGDSLWGIARYHDVHVAQILEWNDMDKENPVIRPGDILTVYVAGNWGPPKRTTPANPAKEDKKKSAGDSSKKSKDDIGHRGKAITYIVQEGDSLWGIARKHDVHVWEIKKLNNMDTDAVRPGQKLTIKPGPGYED